jgi:cyclin-dependent kinase inhibitor FAR1
LNKDDITASPECSFCGSKAKPTDESVLEELYSQTLVNDDDTYHGQYELHTPIIEQRGTFLKGDILPKFPLTGLKPVLFETSTPYTPVNQMTDNLNSAGFQPSAGFEAVNSSITPAPKERPSTLTHRWSKRMSPPHCSNDLIKPQVSILSEYAKHTVDDNISSYTMSLMLNIFTNELKNDEVSSDDAGLKMKINNKVVSLLQKQITDSKAVDFNKLPQLTMFDHFEISLDGFSWESVYAFIFSDVLLIINQEFDSIIGTVLLMEHFTNSVVQDEKTLTLYFSTVTLPELQIRSQSRVVLPKWDDFFTYKLKQGKKVSLMQMTTNSWNLVDDIDIHIPEEITKFNSLMEKGLDLPLNLMKLMLPQPQRLPVNLIVSVPLFNTTQLDNAEYLRNVKQSLRLILDELESQDKFGLVILGRSGQRVLSPKESTFFGMTSSEWQGWDEIIDELESYNSREMGDLNSLVKSLKNLALTVSELSDEASVKKLVILRCTNVSIPIDTEFQWLLDQGFSIYDHLISDKYDALTESLFNQLSDSHGRQQYQMFRHNDLEHFQNSISKMMNTFKRTYINDFKFQFDIGAPFVSLTKVESSGKMTTPQDSHHWDTTLKDLEDGYYHNVRFDITIEVDKLCNEYHFEKNQFQEIPVIKYSYEYQDKVVKKEFSIKLCVKEVTSQQFPQMERAHGGRESSYIDIPLLPPLSSFKDSLFVKKQIELMVIETLEKKGISIHELVSLIFGLIRGCSTSYVEFFKYSRFNKYKNFSFYIDELIKKLNEAKDETLKRDLVYSLSMREEV